MSITSYATLQTEVASWMHRDDLTIVIPEMIALAEERIMRELRAPELETSFSGAISSGQLDVPTGFLSWKAIYIDSSPITYLTIKPLDWLWTNYPTRSSDSTPKFIARNGTKFDFGPYPDSGYTVKGTYYKKLTSVSSSWNAAATAYPYLYLFATLHECALYNRDALMADRWDAKYREQLESANGQAIDGNLDGAPLRMTAG